MRITRTIISTTLMFILFSTAAMAAQSLLTTIHRTTDKSKSELILSTDKNYDISNVLFKIYDERERLDRTVKVKISELQKGKVILTKLGAKVIILQSDNVSSYNGGNIKIIYLKKFKLLGKSKYAEFEVLLDRAGDTWELSKDGVPFRELMAHTGDKGIEKFEVLISK